MYVVGDGMSPYPGLSGPDPELLLSCHCAAVESASRRSCTAPTTGRYPWANRLPPNADEEEEVKEEDDEEEGQALQGCVGSNIQRR